MKKKNVIEDITSKGYEYGFTSDLDSVDIGKGLNEDIIKIISQKKNEPEWLLEYRLKAYRQWQKMKMPTWAKLDIKEIDYQDFLSLSLNKFKNNKYKAALINFNTIRDQYPNDLNAHYYGGLCYYNIDNPVKAIDFFDFIFIYSK